MIKKERKSPKMEFFKNLKIEEHEFVDRKTSLKECPNLWIKKIDS